MFPRSNFTSSSGVSVMFSEKVGKILDFLKDKYCNIALDLLKLFC